MMVEVTCSRCRKKVAGYRANMATGGFYDVAVGYWNRFANSGETVLCDPCMFNDPRYIVIYGRR